MKKIIILCILVLFVSSLNATTLLDFEHSNTRLYGTAESGLVHKSDLNNINIFPASIGGINGNEISMGYVKWYDLLNLMHINYGHKFDKAGVAGISINYLSLTDIKNYDELGNYLGEIQNSDLLFTLGYGQQVMKNLQFGANLKYLNIAINKYSAGWIGCGASAIYTISAPCLKLEKENNLDIGLGLQDINLMKAKFESMESDYSTKLYAGLRYLFLNASIVNCSFLSTFNYQFKYEELYLTTGLEINLFKFLYTRLGYYILKRDIDNLAFGIGINRHLNNQFGISFDYGLLLLHEELAHSVQLGFSF